MHEHFVDKYKVSDNKVNEIVITKNKSIGCKLILTKKRLMISGTFPRHSRLLIALLILILGGIVIPMGGYIINFKGKFKAIEDEVEAYIQSEFSDRII